MAPRAALLGALLLSVLGAAVGVTPGPPPWSGEVGDTTTSQAQWGPFFARHINYQYNVSLTQFNLGFNLLGVLFVPCPVEFRGSLEHC